MDITEAVTERDEPALCPCGNGYTGHVVTDHNGWSNRPTWRAALWLGNDEPLYRAAQAAISRAGGSLDDRAKALRDAWNDAAPDTARAEMRHSEGGGWVDGLYHVDWTEIADGWES